MHAICVFTPAINIGEVWCFEVGTLDSGWGGPASSLGLGHGVAFSGKTLNPCSAS